MSKKIEGGVQVISGAGIVYTAFYLKDLAGEIFDKIKNFPVSDEKISLEFFLLFEILAALGVGVLGGIFIAYGLKNLFSSEEED